MLMFWLCLCVSVVVLVGSLCLLRSGEWLRFILGWMWWMMMWRSGCVVLLLFIIIRLVCVVWVLICRLWLICSFGCVGLRGFG